jgi:uncharacterized protein YecE (DUF72 family)
LTIIGTAGWSIPAQYNDQFPGKGIFSHKASHLERYASQLSGVEINSSFYRSHRRTTYERWAASVNDTFRFSVKVPRSITQNHRLKDYGDLLVSFLDEVSGLGIKLGVLLAQLPPSLAYDAEIAESFFRDLTQIGVIIACEPRHRTWFTPTVDQTLKRLRIVRVCADPPHALTGDVPGGNTDMAYYRLHGSPKMYYSDYSSDALLGVAKKLRKQDWCIFDNTAASHALGNALDLQRCR